MTWEIRNTSGVIIDWDKYHVVTHDEGGVDPLTTVVFKSLFDAQTILHATSDDTPVALTVTEQTLVGRLTGGNISAVAIGIADNNILQIDSATVANLDYAKFTTAGLEGRSYAEVASDIQGSIDHNATTNLTTGDVHTQYFLLAGEATDAKLYSGADLIVYSDAGSTLKMQIDGATGHIGVGQAAFMESALAVIETWEIGDNISRGGLEFYGYGYKTSAAYTNVMYGADCNVRITNANTQNWTDTVGLRVLSGQVVIATGTASSSTITGAAIFYASLSGGGGSANDMVLTNYYGLYIEAESLVGYSKLTNDYGIYIGNQAGGATLNYAIYTNTGLVHFGDDLDFTAGKGIGAFALGGKLTAGATEIEGSAFDIDGGDISAATISGDLTWSVAQSGLTLTAPYIDIIYGYNSTYLRIGDASTTSHALNTDDDLVVTGRLEVDGISFIDGASYYFSNITLVGARGLVIGDDGYIRNRFSNVTDKFTLQGYDVDGTAWRDLIRITNANDPTLEICPSGGFVGFFGATAVGQRLKANYNNWAAISDVTDALVSLGLIDAS